MLQKENQKVLQEATSLVKQNATPVLEVVDVDIVEKYSHSSQIFSTGAMSYKNS